jgi:hypothetical protein
VGRIRLATMPALAHSTQPAMFESTRSTLLYEKSGTKISVSDPHLLHANPDSGL